MIPRLYILGGAAVAVALSYGVGQWRGDARGYARSEAQHEAARKATQADLFQIGEELSRKALELNRVKAENEVLANAIENEARADPDADNRRPSADSLRRLQRRWGAP